MKVRHWLGLVVVTGLAGCQTNSVQPDVQPEVSTASEVVDDALYIELDELVVEWQRGLQAVTDGDVIGGMARVNDAKVKIRSLAEQCAAAAGCDVARVLESYQWLLDNQAETIDLQASRIGLLEGDQQAIESEPGTLGFVGEPQATSAEPLLLDGSRLDDAIELNTPVMAAIDDWLTWNRPRLLDAFANYQHLRPLMLPEYDKAGLPEALLFAMLAAESSGKVHSFSRVGAAGPLQFMRGTGARYGLGTVDGFDQRLDPALSARANAAYLTEHFNMFGHSLPKVLAAYNGGENRMARLQRKYPGMSFWDSELFYSFPRETREYVPRVIAAAWLFQNGGQYRLELRQVDSEHQPLQLEKQTSLSELTICLGQNGSEDGWFRALRNLNPQLNPAEKIEAGDVIQVPEQIAELYADNCLEGDLLVAAAEFHSANYPDGAQLIPYTIRRGDTLSAIARRHRCVSLQELAALNSIAPPRYRITAGKAIRVPQC